MEKLDKKWQIIVFVPFNIWTRCTLRSFVLLLLLKCQGNNKSCFKRQWRKWVISWQQMLHLTWGAHSSFRSGGQRSHARTSLTCGQDSTPSGQTWVQSCTHQMSCWSKINIITSDKNKNYFNWWCEEEWFELCSATQLKYRNIIWIC